MPQQPKNNKNPEAVSLLTPEQYRVTQEDGTERPLQNQMTEETIPRVAVLNAGFVGEARCP